MGLVPYKRDSTEVPSAFHHVRVQVEGTSYELGKEPISKRDHAGALILDLTASRTVKKKCLLLPVCGILL